MLKSAVLLSKKPLHFYIFAEDDLHDSFRNAVSILNLCLSLSDLLCHCQLAHTESHKEGIIAALEQIRKANSRHISDISLLHFACKNVLTVRLSLVIIQHMAQRQRCVIFERTT